MDLFALTSHNEANPVSVLEALACEVPVVAPRVGSLHETVLDGETGYLVEAGDGPAMRERWLRLLCDADHGRRCGEVGRLLVAESWSLEQMVRGYERLIDQIFQAKQ